MVVITSEQMDQLIVVLIAAIPLFGLAIDWLKRKLGEKQGDLAFDQLLKWSDELVALSVIIPDLVPTATQLKALVEASKKLWDDPANNHDTMIVVMAQSEMLYKEAMKLIKAYALKPSTAVKV
ncbi:MAG: hypothetical protein WCO84_07380 [bacterium]